MMQAKRDLFTYRTTDRFAAEWRAEVDRRRSERVTVDEMERAEAHAAAVASIVSEVSGFVGGSRW